MKNGLIRYVVPLVIACGFTSCMIPPRTHVPGPVDRDATPETRNLFFNLQATAGRGILFGHEDSTAYGVGWNGEPGRSDVKDVGGDYPAVYGWDIGHIGDEKNIDGIPFATIAQLIKEAYARGGVNTISAHARNPVTGQSCWDTTSAVAEILPGGAKHQALVNQLDLIAAFMKDLKDGEGRPIPIIFRPWHEHTHDRFWWGVGRCTRDEYVALWRFTIEYLRDEKGVHNLLYAYAPDAPCLDGGGSGYLDRYPGDGYVDVFGVDDYDSMWGRGKGAQLAGRLSALVTMAEQRGKIPALTEAGMDGMKIDDWFTQILAQPILGDPVARRIAYVLVWRNARPDHFFTTYPGHATAPDFVEMRKNPYWIFEADAPDLYAPPQVR
jgi:mannan endo-1,4-beta-mannosidase